MDSRPAVSHDAGKLERVLTPVANPVELSTRLATLQGGSRVAYTEGFLQTRGSDEVFQLDSLFEIPKELGPVKDFVTPVDGLIRRMGGKQQLIADGLLNWFPKDRKVYIEPFGGSFKVLLSKHWSEPLEIINDLDADLVHFYWYVKYDPQKLVDTINSIPIHEAILIGLRQDLKRGALRGVDRAAAFFLITRSSFNGIVDGGFARYASSVLAPMRLGIKVEDVMRVSKRLADVEVRSTDFRRLLSAATKKVDGFAYFDPPYDDTEGYSSLQSESTFGKAEHRQLADYCYQLDELGWLWMQTNSDTPFLRELYGSMRRKDGTPVVTMITREVYYSFSGVADKRAKVKELIFGNFDFTQDRGGDLFSRRKAS